MLDAIKAYLNSAVTPGEAGSQFWAMIYIVVDHAWAFRCR